MEYTKIGNMNIERTAVLAPMAGVTDYAFRITAKGFGAAFMTGEMASAKGLCYSDRKTAELLSVTAPERPMAIQLFGSEPEFMAQAVKIAERYNPDIIDINAGCPVPKIVGNGCGSALMKTPKLFAEVVTAAVSATTIPVTVKIRKGWDDEHVNAVEIAKIAQECGAAAVAVHGRTKQQLYGGSADWEIIAAVKRAVSIPVIGNGDVDSAEKCVEMYEKTGCDLVMVGRAAFGRPWIFKQIRAFIEDGAVIPEPSLTERLDIMKRHIELLAQSKGEFIGMKEARTHAAQYLKGIRNAAGYRQYCGTLSTLEDFYRLLRQIREDLPDEE